MRNELFNQTFDETQYFKRSRKTYFVHDSSSARHALLTNHNQTFENPFGGKRSHQILGDFKMADPVKVQKRGTFKGKLKHSNKEKV